MEKHFCITLKLLYFSNYPTLSPVRLYKINPLFCHPLPVSTGYLTTLCCAAVLIQQQQQQQAGKRSQRGDTQLSLSLPLPSHTLTQKRPKTLTPYNIYYLPYILRYIGNSYKSRSERCALPAGKNLLKLSTSSKI